MDSSNKRKGTRKVKRVKIIPTWLAHAQIKIQPLNRKITESNKLATQIYRSATAPEWEMNDVFFDWILRWKMKEWSRDEKKTTKEESKLNEKKLAIFFIIYSFQFISFWFIRTGISILAVFIPDNLVFV